MTEISDSVRIFEKKPIKKETSVWSQLFKLFAMRDMNRLKKM